jgi:nicotinamidase-related amidase
VAQAITATGRKKLIFAGISLEVCAAFPAITAVGKGLDAYVAVDASGTFSETKRQVGLLRMLQAGVILSDYAPSGRIPRLSSTITAPRTPRSCTLRNVGS